MARANVSDMVRGMGLGMRALTLLVNEVKNQGGKEEVFAFLTRPRFKGNLELIAKAIAGCDWRIPASEMQMRTRRFWPTELGNIPETDLNELSHLSWRPICQEFGIPCNNFNRDPESGEPGFPSFLTETFHGRIMKYPLVIEFGIGADKRREVVVNWDTKDDLIIKPGEVIDGNLVTAVSLARADFFDFDK